MFVVTGALIVVPGGPNGVRYLRRGSSLPDDVPADRRDLLVAKGLVAEATTPEPEPEPEKPTAKPAPKRK